MILSVTSGFVINVFIESAIWGALFSIISVGGYYAINEVAIELEDPFGDDPNDLPMRSYQKNFNARLLVMSYIDSVYACPGPDSQFEPPAEPIAPPCNETIPA